jgi:hypothetical protein
VGQPDAYVFFQTRLSQFLNLTGMKTYCLYLAASVLSFNCLFAQIKNGYEQEIRGIKESLIGLAKMLSSDVDISPTKKHQIRANIAKLSEYVMYYQLTEELLDQFRLIAPELYTSIDSIKDSQGRRVTVYVRFASEMEMQNGAHGTTNLNQSQHDLSLYTSEYGEGTVSIKIASVTKSLTLLAHEFGHVFYQVRNLERYAVDYASWYQNETFNSKYIGHNTNDLSGRMAIEYENLFRDQFLAYSRNATVKIDSPLALLETIRKSVYRKS